MAHIARPILFETDRKHIRSFLHQKFLSDPQQRLSKLRFKLPTTKMPYAQRQLIIYAIDCLLEMAHDFEEALDDRPAQQDSGSPQIHTDYCAIFWKTLVGLTLLGIQGLFIWLYVKAHRADEEASQYNCESVNNDDEIDRICNTADSYFLGAILGGIAGEITMCFLCGCYCDCLKEVESQYISVKATIDIKAEQESRLSKFRVLNTVLKTHLDGSASVVVPVETSGCAKEATVTNDAITEMRDLQNTLERVKTRIAPMQTEHKTIRQPISTDTTPLLEADSRAEDNWPETWEFLMTTIFGNVSRSFMTAHALLPGIDDEVVPETGVGATP